MTAPDVRGPTGGLSFKGHSQKQHCAQIGALYRPLYTETCQSWTNLKFNCINQTWLSFLNSHVSVTGLMQGYTHALKLNAVHIKRYTERQDETENMEQLPER